MSRMPVLARPRSALHAYQREAVDFLKAKPFAAVWLGLGLGKTSIALTAATDLIASGDVSRVLIVAPLRVAVQTWPAEIAAWEHTAATPWTLIRAPADAPEIAEARETARAGARRLGLRSGGIVARAQTRAEERVRERLLRTPAAIHIINREMVPWLVLKWRGKWPYDTIIYDEASGLRDASTHRVRALVHARKHPTLRRFWQFTATPMPESYADLFPQTYLLDQGERFGKSVVSFREAYFSFSQYTRKYTLLPGAADEIVRKVGDMALVMKAEDYLPLNAPVFVDRVLDLEPADLKRYQDLERTLVLSLDTAEIAAETAAALGSKQMQFASGAVYDGAKAAHWAHDAKIDALRDIIEEAQGAPIIVAYWFKSSLDRLRKAFPQGVAMDKEGAAQWSWNKGKTPLLFLHPQSGGHGLNLQHGGHHLVWFDLPWAWELYHQTVGRIARQGQTKVPMVFHLLARDTIDERIVPILQRKESVQEYLFSRLKEARRVLQKPGVARVPPNGPALPAPVSDAGL